MTPAQRIKIFLENAEAFRDEDYFECLHKAYRAFGAATGDKMKFMRFYEMVKSVRWAPIADHYVMTKSKSSPSEEKEN